MYQRSWLTIRQRFLLQIRQRRSEPTTSRDNQRGRSFVDSVLNGHKKAVDDLDVKIIQEDEKRRKIISSQNRLLSLLPQIENTVLNTNCRFFPVGSTVTGLASSLSDLDVVLFPKNSKERLKFIETFHRNDGLKYELMSVLRLLLVNAIHSMDKEEFQVDDCLIFPHLRVPLLICKLVNGDSIDVAVPDQTYHAIRNTALIRNYAMTDIRLSRLLVWLRAWSSSLGIRESKTGLLSSYHILLLAIHFLQSDQSLGSSPVLPILCQTHSHLVDRSMPIDNVIDQLEAPPPEELRAWESRNKMSTAELVIRFIDFYSDMDLLRQSIHIDRGLARRRSSPIHEQSSLFDPYSSTSVCRTVHAFRAFKDAVGFTHKRMRSGLMIDSFPLFSDANHFTIETQFSDWRQISSKKKIQLRKQGL